MNAILRTVAAVVALGCLALFATGGEVSMLSNAFAVSVGSGCCCAADDGVNPQSGVPASCGCAACPAPQCGKTVSAILEHEAGCVTSVDRFSWEVFDEVRALRADRPPHQPPRAGV